ACRLYHRRHGGADRSLFRGARRRVPDARRGYPVVVPGHPGCVDPAGDPGQGRGQGHHRAGGGAMGVLCARRPRGCAGRAQPRVCRGGALHVAGLGARIVSPRAAQLHAAAYRHCHHRPGARYCTGSHAVVPGRGRAGDRAIARHADLQWLRVSVVGPVLDFVLSGHRTGDCHRGHQPGGGSLARRAQPPQCDMSSMPHMNAHPSAAPMLEVRGLKTHFFTRAGVVKAVDGVDLSVGAGEILGLVGESGSGKSITGFSLLGLVDPPGRVVDGEIRLNGEDLRQASPRRWRELRGSDIAMIFQDPMMTLNPVLRVDTQMVETVLAHRRISRADAHARALEVLTKVGIPSPQERLRAYPHQLSGGMRQRVAIAIALLNAPRLIIADEPTTALDVTIQGQILYEMQKLCRETGTGLVWITHDLAVVAGLADR